jgi:hypothetical protein
MLASSSFFDRNIPDPRKLFSTARDLIALPARLSDGLFARTSQIVAGDRDTDFAGQSHQFTELILRPM